MPKKCLIVILVLLLGLVASGCPKKTVMKEEPSASQSAAEKERARLEAEQALREKEAREREEAAKKAQSEFEKSLVAKKYPGTKEKFLKAVCSKISISI